MTLTITDSSKDFNCVKSIVEIYDTYESMALVDLGWFLGLHGTPFWSKL